MTEVTKQVPTVEEQEPAEPTEPQQPLLPAALGGAPHAVYQRLRTETRMMLLPASATVTEGVADLLLHERMMATLHESWTVLPVALGTGSVVNVVVTGVTAWVLARTGLLESIQLKRVLWGSAASGAVLTLFGGHPLVAGGYVVLAGIATAAWHKTRWLTRRALRRALLQPPTELAAAVGEQEALPAAPVQAAAIVPVDSTALDNYICRWRDGVATDSVTGSRLIQPQRHAEGRISFVVDGGPKGVVLATANAAREKIASALRLQLPDADGVGGQDVVFDQPGGMGLDRGQLRMQIINLASSTARSARVTNEVLSAADNPYSVRIGVHIDDGTPTYWDLADDKGVHSGVIAAGTGLGKSSLVDAMAYRARALGFHIAYLDPQRGASSPVLAEHADYPALGTDYALALLRWLEDAADLRESWMAAHRLGKLTPWTTAPCLPTGERPDQHCPCGGVVPPPILTFIEECDQVFTELIPDTNIKLAEPFGRLAKRIRKLRMGLVAVTQHPDLKTFGGSDLLRSNLPVRNLLAMHISSNTSGTLIPGLPYNPKLLPRISGRALMCGERSRVMEATLDWMARREDAQHAAGPYAEDLFAALPRPKPYAPDQAAASLRFHRANDTNANSQQAARQRLAAILGRDASDGTPPITQQPAAAAAGESALIPTQQGWPDPVRETCPPPTAEELEAMLAATAGGTAVAVKPLKVRILDALATASSSEWLTFGELTRRLGRVSGDAETAEVRARARELSAELAAIGVEIPTTRRADGWGATVADIRATLAESRTR